MLRKRQAMETEQKRRLERDIEIEEGDDYILDLRSKAFSCLLRRNKDYSF